MTFRYKAQTRCPQQQFSAYYATINLGSRLKSVVRVGYSMQVFGLPSPLIGEEFHALMLYSAGMVEGFSLFKEGEGMYVAMVEFRCSIK